MDFRSDMPIPEKPQRPTASFAASYLLCAVRILFACDFPDSNFSPWDAGHHPAGSMRTCSVPALSANSAGESLMRR